MRLTHYRVGYLLSLFCLLSACAINEQSLQKKSNFNSSEVTVPKKNIKQLIFSIVNISTPRHSENSGSKIETIVTIEAKMECNATLVEDIKYEYSENKKSQKLNIYVSAFVETKFSIIKNEDNCQNEITLIRELKIAATQAYREENISLINQKNIKNPITPGNTTSTRPPNPTNPSTEQSQIFFGTINKFEYLERSKTLVLNMNYEKGCSEQRFEIVYINNSCLKIAGTEASICQANLYHHKNSAADCSLLISNQDNEFDFNSKLTEIGTHTLNVNFKNKRGMERSFHFSVK
ncbi:MAG: hypothetical protein KBD78_00920 [Oligoflexales bacterium]|nr:hypothetical protein [Oligoflexales bacterium]